MNCVRALELCNTGMKLDKLTARGVLTIAAVIYILAEITAGIINKLF